MSRYLILILIVITFSCKKNEENGSILAPATYPQPILVSPINKSVYLNDQLVTFTWKRAVDAQFYQLVFFRDVSMTDTIKTIKTSNLKADVMLSSLGYDYILYWTVYAFDINGVFKSNPNIYEINFSKKAQIKFQSKFVSPESNTTIYKDSQPTINIKWTKQPTAVSYELQADYNTTFFNANSTSLNNNYSTAKRIIVNSPDTMAAIYKHKIDWNRDMYLRLRAIYANGETSKWSDTLKVSISDPRKEYLGNYILDITITIASQGKNEYKYYYDVPTSITETGHTSLLLSNSSLTWTYHPYYFLMGTETYMERKFYGQAEYNGRPSGVLYFSYSSNGDTIFISGIKNWSSLGGYSSYEFSGYKVK